MTGGSNSSQAGRRYTEWDAASYHRLSAPQFSWGSQVLDRLRLNGDETVIDAGCGTGRLTAGLLERLPRGRVVAVDLSQNMLAEARSHLVARFGGQVEFVRADLAALPFDESFDGVFSTAAFHWGMRCKDYFQARKFFQRLSLSGDPEQRSNERRLPSCITSR